MGDVILTWFLCYNIDGLKGKYLLYIYELISLNNIFHNTSKENSESEEKTADHFYRTHRGEMNCYQSKATNLVNPNP